MKHNRPIVIVKRIKKGHGGHHGGSWKVAYADFVTAMMAFFMVMWLVGLDENIKQAIEEYFSDPLGMRKEFSSGSSMIMISERLSVTPPLPIQVAARSFERKQFKELGERIEAELESSQGLGSIAAQVEVVMTEQGLRIELIEGKDGESFFAFGSAVLKPEAERALRLIGVELAKGTAPVVVEGHTDSAIFGRAGYTNWELSADRANAARRALERAGLEPGRIREIRGHADRHLRIPESPLDPSNRRISVLLPFTTPQGTESPETQAKAVPGSA